MNNICMAGIDHSLANLETRELFSFTKAALAKAYARLHQNSSVIGAVIISTCNRTELYLSCRDDRCVNPFEVLCDLVEVDFREYRHLHRIKKGDDVMKHLCEVACGVKSQVWGEDQIISQVKNSIQEARERKAADSVLEVVFRNAVAAAKKVKTVVKLNARESSVVYKALDLIEKQNMAAVGPDDAHETGYTMDGKNSLGFRKSKTIKEVLVIGNGEIGRLMAQVLTEAGYAATITLREYRHGENVVPKGVSVVDYKKRYEKMKDCQCVISATLSPHHTVSAADLTANFGHDPYPRIFIDLAVPRDIEPEIGTFPGVSLYDMDSLCAVEIDQRKEEQLREIEQITEKYLKDYRDWCTFKEKIVKDDVTENGLRKLYVVGIGPGDEKYMTPQAVAALKDCNVIAGYELYVELVKPFTVGKAIISTGMKKERERCRAALGSAAEGNTVAMVCSGDAGIYGMAGLILEESVDFPKVEIEVIPGITAACSGAALLGAPLIHDFAVISLSDLLTPWTVIEKRLKLAAEADFVISIYNPVSKKRFDYLKRAADILLLHKSPETPCGFAKNIGRQGENTELCTLKDLGDARVDMFSTVVVGNSQTKVIGGKLVTPRGYGR